MDRKNHRVLVVDDDEVALTAMVDLLEDSGYQVQAVTSPVGIADAAESDPELRALVVDLHLPVVRGDNIVRIFRSRTFLRNLPVIMVSGDSRANLRKVQEHMPSVEIVSKSELEEHLVATVDRAICASLARSRPPRPWEG